MGPAAPAAWRGAGGASTGYRAGGRPARCPGVLPLLAEEDMKPPVALLIYLPDQPHRAVYYPFTDFSPEWQALRYAFRSGIPARFMDLPQAIQLAKDSRGSRGSQEPKKPTSPQGPQSSESSPADAPAADPPARPDPLALLAEAAGYSDHELWWERQVEQRSDATGLFEGILEAMTTLRGLSEDEARTVTNTRASARPTCERIHSGRPARRIPAHCRRLRRLALSCPEPAGRCRGRCQDPAGPPPGKGGGHLDTLDQLPALLSERLWRRYRLPRLVYLCSGSRWTGERSAG